MSGFAIIFTHKPIGLVLYPYLPLADILRLSATCRGLRSFLCSKDMPQQWRDILDCRERISFHFGWYLPNPTFHVIGYRARSHQWCLDGCGRPTQYLAPHRINGYHTCIWCAYSKSKSRQLEPRGYDHECLFCAEWCASKSKLGDQFCFLEGTLLVPKVEALAMVCESEEDMDVYDTLTTVYAVCDVCVERENIANLDWGSVIDKVFTFDGLMLVNDE